MSRKATLCTVVPCVDISCYTSYGCICMALAFRDNNDEVIHSYTKNFRNNDYIATPTWLSGISTDNIFKKISMLFPNDFIRNVDEFMESRAGTSVNLVREVTVLYDVSGSMVGTNQPGDLYISSSKDGKYFVRLKLME